MELVAGDTLADRIARGPMPWREAATLLEAIAEGLKAAHESGIVHRDLKPSNVKVNVEGRVKMLDFGRACSLAGGESSAIPALSHSPTLTAQATVPGMLLGTAAYMAPEQARGLRVERRADVWAFGCCLYEALTGVRAFDGHIAHPCRCPVAGAGLAAAARRDATRAHDTLEALPRGGPQAAAAGPG
jgi:serine/threonine-protein kinase